MGAPLYTHAELEAAVAQEREKWRAVLHRISLCSQNSMSSKEECGRIARAALHEAEDIDMDGRC